MSNKIPTIVLFMLLGFALGAALSPRKGSVQAAPADTLLVITRDTVPVPVETRVIRYVSLPADTVRDTIYIPITQLEYRTPQYHAWVSGYQAQLDSIQVTQTTIVKTQYKTKRWGLGIGAGYATGGPYIGIGVQYNLLSW